MRAHLDTNVLVRHLTGDPPAQAQRATRFLAGAEQLMLADLVVAELVYVLESVYRVTRARVAELVRAVLGFAPVYSANPDRLRRALDVYEYDRLDFAEAYLVAYAEESGLRTIASFDRAIDRVASVQRIEP